MAKQRTINNNHIQYQQMKLHFLLLLGLLSLAGCGGGDTSQQKKLRIVTTTGMIEDAVRNIVGDSATVTALMGPGVDPHLYKASQQDLSLLTEADIVFYNGLHLEGKMVEVLEKLARTKPVVAVADGVDQAKLRTPPEFNGNHDPHIWFDVKLWEGGVRKIAETLQAKDTANAAAYRQRAERYLGQLDSLDAWVRGHIATIPQGQRVLITAHDAFGYFGQAYGIEVHGLQGISTVSEYGLADVQALVQMIAGRNIKAVFVESSVPRRSIEAVVEGVKAKGKNVSIGGQLFSDAMGAKGTPEGTYIGMVSANVNIIVNALK